MRLLVAGLGRREHVLEQVSLELHAIVPLNTELSTIRACAFAAAEALMIAQQLAPLPDRLGGLRRGETCPADGHRNRPRQ
ncbi:MAG: hypothetical protein AUG44_10165 [Actinobacteria bacterium 13_1_20CM_3_71_11]|nr:MAG: hypothetical protein AUG44_10165 [Actinobacteria bacterium 13_1_20CM_3_71_11]